MNEKSRLLVLRSTTARRLRFAMRVVLACALWMATHGDAGAAEDGRLNGPEYVPPFEARQSQRVAPERVVRTFLDGTNRNRPAEAAHLVMGNKRIAVRESDRDRLDTKHDNVVAVFVNQKLALSVVFAGGYAAVDGRQVGFAQGYGPGEGRLVCDERDGGIRWLRRYPLPDGAPGEFRYQLKPAGGGRVELSWDTGYAGNDGGAGATLYLSMPGAYREAGVELNGALQKLLGKSELESAGAKGVDVWNGGLKKLVYSPEKPDGGFALTLADGPAAVATETFAYGSFSLSLRVSGGLRGSMLFDFGATPVRRGDAPPPVEGHDLWAQDALHLPKSPTRNLFPNSSFEQGLRYWRWWSGGAQYRHADIPRFAVDDQRGLFGKSALVVNPVQPDSMPLMSFSLPGRKGQTYTVSFHAKAENPDATAKLALFSTKTGGQFDRGHVNRTPANPLTTEWQRFSESFVSDGAPVALVMGIGGNRGRVWLDGIQVEAGEQATAFASPPFEGRLVTAAAPDNNLEAGHPIQAAFEWHGNPGAAATAAVTLSDFYKAILWRKTFDMRAGQRTALPFDDLRLAPGAYFLRVDYHVPGAEPYTDYYRFAIIDSLDGTHATKDLYGNLFSTRLDRTEDLCALMRRCGFGGSTSYGPGRSDPFHYEIRRKYGIADYTHTLMEGVFLTPEESGRRFEHPDYLFLMELNSRIWRTPEMARKIKIKETYTEEDARRVEDIAFRSARDLPDARVWSFGTEEESCIPSLAKNRDFKGYASLLRAFHRGIKRGNPKAIVMPSGGTSGFGRLRGKDAIEGYLAATPEIKWDAVAIHPYGSIDGTLGRDDLDENIRMLSDSIAKFGYGPETPIYLNEGGGGSPARWGDGPDYSYVGGQPSYDLGLHEFLHAALMARQYIICLKYWPRLAHFNTWQGDFRVVVDYLLTPSPAMLAVNTLGRLLAQPTFLADLRPAPGVRGYAFKDEQGNGVAAIWCTLDNVELGFERGPELRVLFDGALPELFDLMGRAHPVTAGADGRVAFRLTPAPLFLRAAAADKLVAALQNAEAGGAGASVNVSFLPARDGAILAQLENLTGRVQEGKLRVGGGETPFRLDPMKTSTARLPDRVGAAFGRMFEWSERYTLAIRGTMEPEKPWHMAFFHVPRVDGPPDWTQVPAIALTNLYRPIIGLKQTPGGHAGDIAATFQAAWDKDNFYLRVVAEDDILKTDAPAFWDSADARRDRLYALDGCLEVYFDCGANGRLRKGGFDLDDYRYDFAPGNPEGASGSGLVNRLREVYVEYAGGPEMPSKADAAAGVACEFTRLSTTTYAYTITFAQKFVEPLRLKAGAVAGFGLYLHDRMDDGAMGDKGLSLATEPGAHCDAAPHLWPLMILGDEER